MGTEITLLQGDCREVLATLPAESVDACVCDPPYHLTSIVKRFGSETAAPAKGGVYARSSAGFMGQKWDGGDVAFQPETWAEVLRVLKPGAHLLAFGGTRTYHRLACAIEDAGFEVRDQIMWLYGSGFNKVGMIKNRHPELWCKCSDKPSPEYDLRQVRNADLSSGEHSEDQRSKVLLSRMQEQDIHSHGTARPQSEASDGEQPGVEGRQIHRAGQGLRDGAEQGSSASEAERLRVRAHSGGRGDARPGSVAGRGSSPQEPGQGGQQAGQFEGLRDPSGALDGGALRGSGRCPRCGGISQAFDGFAGSLKPAHEPIILARKPLIGTVAGNMAAHGTGALNIDGCRVGVGELVSGGGNNFDAWRSGEGRPDRPVKHGVRSDGHADGRWPANVAHDGSDEVLEAFARFGEKASGSGAVKRASSADRSGNRGAAYGAESRPAGTAMISHADTGSAARFFYEAKASREERGEGNNHPTVKPLALMRWLCRLITPPGGTVLDPFLGSGSTAIAADQEGFSCIGIEQSAEYLDIARRRIAADAPLLTEVA